MNEHGGNRFFLEGLSPKCVATLTVGIADVLTQGLNAGQMNVLGVFISSVGDLISTMAAQIQFNEEICEKIDEKKDE